MTDEEIHVMMVKANGGKNRRSGKMNKTAQSEYVSIEIGTPRDRNGSFQSEIVKKRETILTEGLSDEIIRLYTSVPSTRDIRKFIEENYGRAISAETNCHITDKVQPENPVLTDLKNRGVKDVLIACIDGLKGFPDAINAVFPRTDVQLCIVNQIRNSLKYVASKNQMEFLADLRLVYQAETLEKAEIELGNLATKWGEKHPIVIRSWLDNWSNLSCYFQYTSEIRRLIYTTDTIDGYHRQIRKVTKTKGVFSSDDSLLKLVYLAYRNIKEKWNGPLTSWPLIAQQLCIKFEDRFKVL